MKTLVDYVSGFRLRSKSAFVYKTGFRTLSYSYKSVRLMSLQTAAFLKSLGLKKGDRAIIWAPNSPQWAVFFLGCVLAGVVAVPLDVHCDPGFVREIKKRVGAKLVFQTRYKAKAVSVRTVVAEELEDLIANLKPADLPKVKESDIVQILYTSGTTSKPKGVVHDHKNLVGNVEAVAKVFKVEESHKLLSVLPLSHVFEQTGGFWLALSRGATVVYLRTLKPSALAETIKKDRVTAMLVVPRVLSLFESSMKDRFSAANLSWVLSGLLGASAALPFGLRKAFLWFVHRKFGRQFRYFVVGGAPFSREQERFWSVLGFSVFQGYGMTEASPVISINSPGCSKAGSVGKILPGCAARLNDQGEVFFKGVNVTRGYFKDPEKTRGLFENGWLKTGDLGELDSEGFLYLKGRKKNMISVSSGLNVYAEDVESVLNSQQGIRESCVVGIQAGGGEVVHAVLLTSLSRSDAEARVKTANGKLMSHQQIQDFTIWPYSDFPRTPTLKIIRKQVVEKIGRKSTKKEEVYGGRDRVCGLIAQVAGVSLSKIKLSSVLSRDLGMSSIDRIELVTLLEIEFNLDVDESLINQKTTVQEVEKIVSERKSAKRQRQQDWAMSGPVRFLGAPFRKLLYSMMRRYAEITVQGVENLPLKSSQAVFIANHTSNLDTPAILMNLPLEYQSKMAVAAWGEWYKTGSKGRQVNFLNRIGRTLIMQFRNVLISTYAFDRSENSLQSLQYTGKLVDEGHSILIFPEGQITETGKMLPFENGIGILVQELRVPVVPVRLRGLHEILPPETHWPVSKGEVTVKFGKPIPYEALKNKSVVEITKTLEKHVKML